MLTLSRFRLMSYSCSVARTRLPFQGIHFSKYCRKIFFDIKRYPRNISEDILRASLFSENIRTIISFSANPPSGIFSWCIRKHTSRYVCGAAKSIRLITGCAIYVSIASNVTRGAGGNNAAQRWTADDDVVSKKTDPR